MSNGVFTGTIIRAKDGSLNVELQSLRVKASKRFTPSQLLPLQDWLNSAKDSWDVVEGIVHAQKISYSHEDNKLRLETAGGVKYYGVDDESLARLVRYLKTRAPLPRSVDVEQPLPLPIPTDAELANRTIYKNPGIPNGYSGQGTIGKPKLAKASMASQRAKVKSLVAGMIAERKGGV